MSGYRQVRHCSVSGLGGHVRGQTVTSVASGVVAHLSLDDGWRLAALSHYDQHVTTDSLPRNTNTLMLYLNVNLRTCRNHFRFILMRVDFVGHRFPL